MAGRTVVDDIVWLFDEEDRLEEEPEVAAGPELVAPEGLEDPPFPFGDEDLEPFGDTQDTDDPFLEIQGSILAEHDHRLGRAAYTELAIDLGRAIKWARAHHQPERGPFAVLARASAATCVGRFYERHPAKRLRMERLDQLDRDAALAEG